MAIVNDEVTLVVNGRAWSGWKSVRITRGVERMPSDFSVVVTEKYPDTPGIDIQPGQPVTVKVGSDALIVGFIDRYSPSIDPTGHAIEITGRGRCMDLVDCSASFDGMQILQTTTLGVAQIVTKRFGIDVISLDGPGVPIPAFNSVLTETPFQVIERVTRYSGLLAFEGRDGNLILARAGTIKMASGFKQGVNVQTARYTFSVDQRFAEIAVISTSVDTFWQATNQPKPVGLSDGNTVATVYDPAIRKERLRLVVAESGFAGLEVSIQRASWERARRMGRSYAVTVTVDSWRDSAGYLWAPNAGVKVDLPALKVPANQDWVISEVSFLKSQERGTVAEVTVMPASAFSPEPINLFPVDKQVQDELNRLGQGGPYDPLSPSHPPSGSGAI